jgi:hypothetical protein
MASQWTALLLSGSALATRGVWVKRPSAARISPIVPQATVGHGRPCISTRVLRWPPHSGRRGTPGVLPANLWERLGPPSPDGLDFKSGPR